MTDAQSAQTALDKLIEAVEAGECSMWLSINASHAHGPKFLEAFDGSLDAALALHEALLPGQDWCVSPSASYAANGFKARSSTPARAWLLAILRAYRSTQP